MLTSSLEDYLETIFEQVRDQKVARVRDIAKARGVQAGSVSPAMKRLAELGYIRYVQREYIDLTPEGEREARRVLAKHQLLARFFEEVLQVPSAAAQADACAVEHSISTEGMEHLVRFFEFLQVCPEGQAFLSAFHQCVKVQQGAPGCDRSSCGVADALAPPLEEATMSISELRPGDKARVRRVNGCGAVRQRLLDMGILPDVMIEVERVAPVGDPIWIKLQGFQLSLRRKEAESILVTAS